MGKETTRYKIVYTFTDGERIEYEGVTFMSVEERFIHERGVVKKCLEEGGLLLVGNSDEERFAFFFPHLLISFAVSIVFLIGGSKDVIKTT